MCVYLWDVGNNPSIYWSLHPYVQQSLTSIHPHVHLSIIHPFVPIRFFHLSMDSAMLLAKLRHVGFERRSLFQPTYVTLCVCICVCLHEDMSATVVSRHVLKEARECGGTGANVVGTSGDEVTFAKATTPSWKQLHPVSSSCWQTLLQRLAWQPRAQRARQEKLGASCLASHHLQPWSERRARSHDAGLD